MNVLYLFCHLRLLESRPSLAMLRKPLRSLKILLQMGCSISSDIKLSRSFSVALVLVCRCHTNTLSWCRARVIRSAQFPMFPLDILSGSPETLGSLIAMHDLLSKELSMES